MNLNMHTIATEMLAKSSFDRDSQYLMAANIVNPEVKSLIAVHGCVNLIVTGDKSDAELAEMVAKLNTATEAFAEALRAINGAPNPIAIMLQAVSSQAVFATEENRAAFIKENAHVLAMLAEEKKDGNLEA